MSKLRYEVVDFHPEEQTSTLRWVRIKYDVIDNHRNLSEGQFYNNEKDQAIKLCNELNNKYYNSKIKGYIND